MKVLKGNIVKCDKCKSFLQYNDNDIEHVQMYYTVATYNGETYTAKIITCPVCKERIEVY